MSEFLSSTELHALTGYARAGQQAAWLKAEGIPCRIDSSRVPVRVIVSREHVRNWLEGRTVVTSTGLNLAGIK